MLLLAQPEGSPVELDTVDLATWLAEHVGRLSEDPRASDLRVEVLGDGPLAARVNPLLLGQLVDNLLDNAFKYSPAGSPVTVRCWAEPGSLRLSVADRGSGLSGEEAARVFEPFYRTDQSRRDGQPGVGLGLPVAQRIAAAFGGSLDVLSEPGSGCVFALRLPAEAVAEDQVVMAAASHGP